MKISLLNYEEYVMDFLEDNLEEKEKMAFLCFLQENPSIEQEITQINDPILRVQASQTILFPHVELLKKKTLTAISPSEQVALCRQYLNNDSSAAEKAYVERLLYFYPSFQQTMEKERRQPDAAVSTAVTKKTLPLWLLQAWGAMGSIAALVLAILYAKQQLPAPTHTVIVEAPNALQRSAKINTKTTQKTLSIGEEIMPISEDFFALEPIELDMVLPELAAIATTLLEIPSDQKTHVLEFDNERKTLKSLIKIIGFSVKKQKNE